MFPQKLQQAQDECLTICLPDIRSIQDDVNLDSEFFDLHILREQVDEGWYKSSNPKLPLIVELVEDKNKLKLLSAPNYHPSFQNGLYYVTISDVILGTNKVRGIRIDLYLSNLDIISQFYTFLLLEI